MAENGDFIGYNLFVYCGNNPVNRQDMTGNAWETAFDVISLGASIADVALNPADPWAWAGLIGDIIDVAVPFVGGIGESVKLLGVVDDTSDVITAAKRLKNFTSQSTGAYEIMYKSGKNYVGKGSFSRAITSAMEHAKPNKLNDMLGDEVISITWKKASSNREAFMMEYLLQHKGRGVLSADKAAQTYNKIWSPGKNMLQWN